MSILIKAKSKESVQFSNKKDAPTSTSSQGPPKKEGGSVPNSERMVFLDGLRGLLALFVVIGHFSVFLPAKGEGMTLLAHGFRLPAFFALSGFVLYLSSADRPRIEMKTPFRTYFSRRLLRLYPTYAIALIFFHVFIYAVVAAGVATPNAILPRSNESLLVHLLYLQSWHPDFDIKFGMIAPVWMLGYELQLALLLPVFLAIARNLGWVGLLALGVCLITPEAQRWNQDANEQYLFYPSFTLAFFLGLAAVRAVKAAPPTEHAPPLYHTLWRHRGGLALGTAIISLVTHLVLFFRFGSSSSSESLAGLSVAAFCAFLALRPTSFGGRILSSRLLLFFGTISYSLFLVHFPLIRFTLYALGHWNIPNEGNYLVAAGLFLIILLAAVIMYRFCENPINAWRERTPRKGIASKTSPIQSLPNSGR
jgi:peptidoglycan/LPS O-acetylase OafA/YrhL